MSAMDEPTEVFDDLYLGLRAGGALRKQRRGEARGLLVHDVGERELRVQTYVWRGDTWGLAAERLFPRRPVTPCRGDGAAGDRDGKSGSGSARP